MSLSRKNANAGSNANYENTEQLLGALLRIPYQEITSRVQTTLANAGHLDLRIPHIWVLQYLDERTQWRVTELAKRAQVTKQDMAYLVEYLAVRNYVAYVPDITDRRAKLIVLTEKGRQLRELAIDAINRTQEEWANCIGEKRMQDLLLSLKDITASIAETEKLKSTVGQAQMPSKDVLG